MSVPAPRPTGGIGISRFAQQGTHRLSYESAGATDGNAVLLLHDLLADRGSLRQLAGGLVEAGWRITLPDASGHGASPMISGRAYPLPQLVADVHAVLDAEGLASSHIVAFGWGALTALALGSERRPRASSLLLVEPYLPALLHAHPNEEAQKYGAAHLEALAQAGDAAYKGLTDRALDLYPGVRWGTGWRDRVPKHRLAAIRRGAANLSPLLALLGAAESDLEMLHRINLPVTIFTRRNGPQFEQWNAEALSLHVAGCGIQNVILPAGDSTPAAWSAAIQKTLTRQSR